MNSSINTITYNNATLNTQDIKSATTPAAADQQELLTVNQLREMLNITWLTLHRRRKAGKGLRYIRAGAHSIRYRRADVEAWLAEHTSW